MSTASLENKILQARQALFDRLYANLNDRQREAVYCVNGPLLVLAGAGSGKTTVLVKRISHIIKFGNAFYNSLSYLETDNSLSELESGLSGTEKNIEMILRKYAVDPCPPWAILAITFTNKAANEMKQRLAFTLGEEIADQICAGTFHSVCVRILRRYCDKIGIDHNFTIYDSDESKKTIIQCIADLGYDEKMFVPRHVQSVISLAKNKLMTPDELEKESVNDFTLSKIAQIYKVYCKKLSVSNALDFDDLIMCTVRLLKDCEEIRKYYQHHFKYVCIDEYQDTNTAQFELAKLLSDGYRNLMVVGDDDQSIYRFRGATIENILSFDKQYPDAKVVKLEQNYRSTQNILNAANAVIANNTGRHEKRLWSALAEGDKIVLKKAPDQNAEARFIIKKIEDDMKQGGHKFSDFAVLFRMNAQSNVLENVFARSGIPYRMLGGIRFKDRMEIKDITSYLCVINNPRDELNLDRIINVPKRKIGDATISAVREIAATEGIYSFEVMRNADKYIALSKAAPKLKEFVALIDELKSISETESLPVLFEKTIEKTGYEKMILEMGTTELDRLENIKELISDAVEYSSNSENPSLQGFLEEAALISDIDNYDEKADAVVLMTIHSAKGLEFPTVFLPGMEDGIFPSLQSKHDDTELEEERRLAYVAITRAKSKLYLIHVKQRMLFGRTQFNPRSQFISEIPSEYIDDQTEPSVVYTYNNDKVFPKKNNNNFSFITDKKQEKSLTEQFKSGDSVIHPMFGRGDIISVRPMGGDTMYEIAFDDYGTKKLMATYAKLKRG